MILAGHNRERALLGVAPLVWNNEMASRAQDWVNYNLAHGTLTHCIFVKGWEQIESCTHDEGENGAAGSCVPHPQREHAEPTSPDAGGLVRRKSHRSLAAGSLEDRDIHRLRVRHWS